MPADAPVEKLAATLSSMPPPTTAATPKPGLRMFSNPLAAASARPAPGLPPCDAMPLVPRGGTVARLTLPPAAASASGWPGGSAANTSLGSCEARAIFRLERSGTPSDEKKSRFSLNDSTMPLNTKVPQRKPTSGGAWSLLLLLSPGFRNCLMRSVSARTSPPSCVLSKTRSNSSLAVVCDTNCLALASRPFFSSVFCTEYDRDVGLNCTSTASALLPSGSCVGQAWSTL